MSNKVTTVYVRLIFLRIGEIDTLNEKYQAQASIESRWAVDSQQLLAELSADDQQSLADGKSVSLLKYTESHWHPQLYIENALGDLKEQIRYTAKISKNDNRLYICEQRDIKGLFWEKLELYYFPSDIQDLSISVASMLCNDRVVLLPDGDRKSGVNREAFVDQQEWYLYAHVDTEQRVTDEFDFESLDEDDRSTTKTGGERKRTIVTVTCHVARRSSYFYWNGYCLIFLITLVSYTCFFIPPSQMYNRIQVTCTLLLTSITFRWTVNRSLPTVSYLTTLDIYGMVCMFALVVSAIWHTLAGYLTFEYTANFTVTPRSWQIKYDRIAFCVQFGLFVLGNIAFLIWLHFVPLKQRRIMHEKDMALHLRNPASKRKSSEIDTLNEKYQAQASIESRWAVDSQQLLAELSADDQQSLTDGKSVSLLKYTESHWHPQLYIENALGDLKEQIRYTAKLSKDDTKIDICEQRDIKGLFWEKLELYHFPNDVQDLSISVASMLYNDRVVLLPDGDRKSGVNREAFVDQQEWNLYAHVDTEQRTTDEFDFETLDEDDRSTTKTVGERKRTIVTVTCHAARESSYFYWNGFCLIFLITLISYTCYFIPPHQMVNRIQTSSTLLLTSITFRWTVNRSLPTISYLTTMDKYGIACIFSLVVNVLWHTFIGYLTFEYTPNFSSNPHIWQVKTDRMAFCVSFSIFILSHIFFVIWLLAVPLNHRRKMHKKDAALNLTKPKGKRSLRVTEIETERRSSSARTADDAMNLQTI
ncbi:unnamed protein product [Adineta ricciae]|uniref:Uncharacterized protein n=1 Tax=Adineta ricciae TaxID=249248 RepID=A0A815T2G8_ADIRI|nr:unnamed protein product [Adineta ricciae]